MQPKYLSDDIAVAAQISTDDLSMVNSLGFKSVLCARPDGEEGRQDLFNAIKKSAKNAGLEARYAPIATIPPTGQELEVFISAFHSLPKPIFAYGSDGSRCEALYNAMLARGETESRKKS